MALFNGERSIINPLSDKVDTESDASGPSQPSKGASDRTVPPSSSLQTEGANEERPQAPGKESGPSPRLQFLVQCLLCLFTLGAFIAAGVYAWIANEQKTVMNGQYESMTAQWLTMRQTLAEMQMQTLGATKSADAATSAADTASAAFKESEAAQRPYIVHRSYRKSLQIKAMSPIFINIEYVNWGKTLAVNVATSGVVLFGNGASSVVDKYFSQLPERLPAEPTYPKVFVVPSGGVPPPQQSAADIDAGVPEGIYTTISSAPSVPNQEAISFISQNEFAVFIMGRTWYDDTNGNHYRTDFCYFHLLSGAIAHCPAHNEVH